MKLVTIILSVFLVAAVYGCAGLKAGVSKEEWAKMTTAEKADWEERTFYPHD